jgi:hypothetical protein
LSLRLWCAAEVGRARREKEQGTRDEGESVSREDVERQIRKRGGRREGGERKDSRSERVECPRDIGLVNAGQQSRAARRPLARRGTGSVRDRRLGGVLETSGEMRRAGGKGRESGGTSEGGDGVWGEEM